MNKLEQELNEFVDRTTLPLVDGEDWWQRGNSVVREASDIIGHVLDAFDDENRAVELAELKANATEIVQKKLAESNTKLPFLIKKFLPSGMQMAIDAAVDGGEDISDWFKEEFVPVLQEPHETLAHMIHRFQRN